MKVREAFPEELEEVFLMGYDSWGAGLPVRMYLDSCEASYKYKKGVFYVLEDPLGRLLTSAALYSLSSFGGVVSERAVGIGSLATIANERHQGYATLFLSMLIELLERDGVDSFFIHSDIHPRIYENLGFHAAPTNLRVPGDVSVPMLRLRGGRTVSVELWREIVMPSYF